VEERAIQLITGIQLIKPLNHKSLLGSIVHWYAHLD